MYTGLIETIGKVIVCEGERLVIQVPRLISQLAVSESIAIDGVCLTVGALDAEAGTFQAELSPETRRRTTLGGLSVGQQVNLERPLPADRDGILAALADDRLIRRSDAGGWDIAHLGAILFAKRLDAFHMLSRKAMRVVQYRGIGRTETLKEQEGTKGYACGFEGLIGYIHGLLPANEVMGQALRKTVPMFPELAVRELVANALIHQDFFVTGSGPMVEIFDDRIEITNPGEPLVDTQRFVDTPPRSRNEALASLMRRFRICEERGSGIDKVVSQVELFQLPAPLFESPEGFTRTVLFAHKDLKDMDREDRIRACYLHACLRYVTRQPMTNTSVRERFGIAPANKATASRLIREALEAGVVRLANEDVADKLRAYVPFWA